MSRLFPKAYVQRSFEPVPGTKGPAKERFLVLTDVSHPTELAAYGNASTAAAAVRIHNKAVDNADESDSQAVAMPTPLPVEERRDVYVGTLDELRKVERTVIDGALVVRVFAVSFADLPEDERAQIEAALGNAAADDASAGIGPDVTQLTAHVPRTVMPSKVEVTTADPIQAAAPGGSSQFRQKR